MREHFDWRSLPWDALVIASLVVLLPIGRFAELPVLVSLVVVVTLMLRGRGEVLRGPGFALTVALFACYWLPILLSGFAAIQPTKTWSTAASALRFLPFALFIVAGLSNLRSLRGVLLATAAVILIWLIDAWVQMATGFSIAGSAERERLAGIFGADNLKLGPVLATLSPFLLLALRARFGRLGLAFGFVALVGPILMAGSRAAWLSFALVCAILLWRETRHVGRFLALIAGLAIALLVAGGAAWKFSDRFDHRIDRTLLALQGTVQAVDEASAGRLSIWRAARGMIVEHPWTGVGARGFRYAYPDYAAKGDRFVETDSDTGASHAHQIVLEVLSETGVIGLLLWLIGTTLAVRAWLRATALARDQALAPALALVAMTFPLNTHLAFYSAWWGLLFWWLLALYIAALHSRDQAGISNDVSEPQSDETHQL
ncbi:MAG: O-antigen ligase family protein [Dokdonella sp.]